MTITSVPPPFRLSIGFTWVFGSANGNRTRNVRHYPLSPDCKWLIPQAGDEDPDSRFPDIDESVPPRFHFTSRPAAAKLQDASALPPRVPVNANSAGVRANPLLNSLKRFRVMSPGPRSNKRVWSAII
jgi:hypothetical protein